MLQELLRKGVSRSDCQAALESVFGESTRGKIRVNMDAVEDIDEETDSLFGTEGEYSVCCAVSACTCSFHMPASK